MRVNVAFAFEHFDERFEAQIAARRDEIFFTGSGALVVVVPRFLVIAGFDEGAANGFFDAHASGRITLRVAGDTEVRAFHVLAEGKLDARERTFEGKLRGGLAPAKLDDQRLSTDGVSRAVENICGGDSAREVAIDVDVVRVQDLRHIYDRGDGNAALVNAFRGDVRMAVDNAGDDELSRGV